MPPPTGRAALMRRTSKSKRLRHENSCLGGEMESHVRAWIDGSGRRLRLVLNTWALRYRSEGHHLVWRRGIRCRLGTRLSIDQKAMPQLARDVFCEGVVLGRGGCRHAVAPTAFPVDQ